MAPAFSSPRQAAAFALLLLVLLLLPVLAGKSFLPSREQMYAQTGRQIIDFPNFHHAIFEEKGDIDIAIMSSSRLGCSLDPAYLEKKLSERLGRPATVRSLTWTWNGYDALYFIAQDLLEKRKVHLLLFCDLSEGANNIAHHQTSYWFRYADNAEALAGLPLKSKASFYASAILGLPRNLVGLLRPNLAAIPSHAPLWNLSPCDYTPEKPASPSEVCVYSRTTKQNFEFSRAPLPPMQREFVRKIGKLAQEHGTRLAFLHISDYAERGATRIEERTFWPDAFGVSLPMIGIAPANFFAGMKDDEILQLYFNPTHFNQNGRNYFESLVTPAIIEAYEDQR